MRLYMMENDESNYIEIPDEIEELDKYSTYRRAFVEKAVKFIRSKSQNFINEFYTNNIIVYRGEDGLSTDAIFTRKTREKRKISYGNITSDHTFRQQLNDYFEKQGIARRDEHVVFTTTQQPTDFKGVAVDQWFYFLPVGGYEYSYSKGPSGRGDINISQDIMTKNLNDLNQFFTNINGEFINRYLSNLKSMKNPISELNDQIFIANNDHNIIDKSTLDKELKKINDNYDYIIENIEKVVSQSTNLEYLITNGLEDIMKKVKVIITKYINTCMESYQNIKNKFADYDGDIKVIDTIGNKIKVIINELQSLENELEVLFIDNYRIKDVLENFKENVEENFITNSIDDGIDDNELWFNTKEYILIPYSTIGDEIVEELKD
ncbi:hypothetical protein PBI_SCTP2_22 [Salicola phage SCTP-2]|nr:hypothetical protein PBI_SCTP2_22 [Salicola phage SCTP-2]